MLFLDGSVHQLFYFFHRQKFTLGFRKLEDVGFHTIDRVDCNYVTVNGKIKRAAYALR